MSAAVDALLGRLDRVKKSGDGWIARCPSHEDKVASLSVGEGADGRALIRCFAGCTTEAVCRALELELGALFEPREPRDVNGSTTAKKKAKSATVFVEEDVQRYATALLSNGKTLARLEELRGWTAEACERLGLGLDGDRVVFSYRDAAGALVGVGRYRPNPAVRGDRPKMQAAAGSRRELFPSPESLDQSEIVWLVEGEPDAVRATSLGLAACGLPGVSSWRTEWAARFAGHRVIVVFDCDAPGREATTRVAADLMDAGVDVVGILDLDLDRGDGYDLSDFTASAVTAEDREAARELLVELAAAVPAVQPPEQEGVAALLEDVAAFISAYVVLSSSAADALALWTLHTHAVEAAETTPYIAVTSAEKRCGKTTLLSAMRLLVREPLPTMNISDAALFRVIAKKQPTLLFDEIDAIFGPKARDREDLRGLLNSGHSRGQHAYRMGGASKTELEAFETFCPKLLAGIGQLPDTIADRSVPIRLKRKAPGETAERFRRREVAPIAEPLKVRIEKWADESSAALTVAEPNLPDALDDRAADCWEPLLAIADLAGGGWPGRARAAALELSADRGDADEDSLGVRLLADIRNLLDRLDVDRISTADLLDFLHADDEAPWGDYYGKPLSPRQLAKLLKRYQVRRGSIRTADGKNPRGYLREWLEDAFSRYLPSVSATCATTAWISQKQGVSEVPHERLVAHREVGANPHGYADVAHVAHKTPERGFGTSRAPIPGLAATAAEASCSRTTVGARRAERRRQHEGVSRGEGPQISRRGQVDGPSG